MKFIQSQYITAKLTHLTPEDGYHGMKKNGIKIPDRGKDSLIYKPPGFFISMNGDWERWCTAEEFRNVDGETICEVYVKPNLTFIRIENIEDANDLVRFLLPDIKNEFPDLNDSFDRLLGTFPGGEFPISDLLNFTRYQIKLLKKGVEMIHREVWGRALASCDGIYYVNSWELHMNTIFNAWDCDTLMLFDPRNVVSLQKQD